MAIRDAQHLKMKPSCEQLVQIVVATGGVGGDGGWGVVCAHGG